MINDDIFSENSTSFLTGMRVYDAFQEIRYLKYKGNGKDRAHENQILKIFEKVGFTILPASILTDRQKEDIKNKVASNLIQGSQQSRFIIHEPLGSQSSPDFLVSDGNKIFYIDAKTSKTTFPLWNSGLPDLKTLYIFTSQKLNTILFRGNQIITEEDIKMYNSARDFLDQQSQNIIPSNSLFDLYVRPMYNHRDPKYFVKNGNRLTEDLIQYIISRYG